MRAATLVAGLWFADASPADAAAADSFDVPCRSPASVRGIDVSSFQGDIDWRAVKGAGVSFAFARMSDGLDVIDATFAANYVGMKRAGLHRGAYQVFRASLDPEAQADLLVKTVLRLGRPDLPMVADVETSDGVAPAELQARLSRWSRRVEKRSRRRPIIYTSPAMSPTLGPSFGRHHLWLAHYDVDCPRLPDGWDGWTFWQHSSSGRVAGIRGDVDLDVFVGTRKQLRQFGRAGGDRGAARQFTTAKQ